MATVNLGVTFGQAGRREEEIGAYRHVIVRFGETSRPELQEEVARAMVYLGITLGQVGRREEAIAAYRDLISRFGESSRPELQEQVARAMVSLGFTFGQAGRLEEAISTFRDVIGRYGESSDPELQDQFAIALVNLGFTFGQAGRPEEAIATFGELISRFGGSPRPALQEVVLQGRRLLASRLRRAGRKSESQVALTSAWRQLASMTKVDGAQLDAILREALCGLPLAEAAQVLDELSEHPDSEARETARLYRFVLEVVKAQEPAEGRPSLTPAVRKRRVLDRVPPEIRAVVKEKAAIVSKERKKESHTIAARPNNK